MIRHQILADDFTENSPKRWGTKFYNQKLENEAKVISELGRQYTNDNPAICGLIEVENRQVIEDLIKQPALAKAITELFISILMIQEVSMWQLFIKKEDSLS